MTAKTLVIGRAGMDLAPEPAGTAIENAVTFAASLGGSAANIAVGFARLGAAADLLTSVSSDPVGTYCINALKSYGVGAHLVKTVSGEYRTSLALSEARVENHRTVIYRNHAADFAITPEDANSVNFEEYSRLVITGTALSVEPSQAAVFEALRLSKKAGCSTVLDIDYRPYSWTSPQQAQEVLNRAALACDIIVGNDEEFGFLAGDSDQGEAIARQLAQDANRVTIYKMGARGSMTFQGNDAIHSGIFPAKALKPTGAGDSFLAGLLVSLDKGLILEQAILRGSACASMVVSRAGCAPAMPTETELESFLNSNTPASFDFGD